jgi:ATP-dependent DNA helicase RecG
VARAQRRPTAAGRPSVERLRDAVRRASKGGFADIESPEIGRAITAAWPACAPTWSDRPEAARVTSVIAQWDEHGRQAHVEVVATLMRLLAEQGPPPPRAVPQSGPPPDDPRDAGVQTLPGVGPSTAAKLRERGLGTVGDLAWLLPSGYVDLRRERSFAQLVEGEVAMFVATVRGLRQGFARGRFMAAMELDMHDEDGALHRVVARWFHPMSGLANWAKDGRVRVIGTARMHAGQWQFAHPQLLDPDASPPAISVRYPVVEGIPAGTVTKLVKAAVERVVAGPLPDPLPASLRAERDLIELVDALRLLHFPSAALDDATIDELVRGVSKGHRRIAFDELLFVQVSLAIARRRYRDLQTAVRVVDDAGLRERAATSLPFAMTGAQRRATAEILAAMAEGPPMMRLLQGDVGSGKTAVAFVAALAIAAAGAQTAFMAPTEILAEQHYRTLLPWCSKAGLTIALLTGSTAAGTRESLVAMIAAGRVDIVIGTHALLTSDVGFAILGLVVIDEQHRFGVEQRRRLLDKGARPHLLVMTATPIPRSLALVAYGELDISVIDQMPPGREPPVTHVLCGPKALVDARRLVAERVRAGEQAFVVCPLVEASDAIDVTDVLATASRFAKALPDHQVGVVHGRLAARDKDAVMAAFRAQQLAVLVATTVIEVGVDVPTASAILVEHAERFGLSQLHQLRGRVGRGGGGSICVLHSPASPDSEIAARLRVLAEHADGFAVAEADLQLRGPGEVFGRRQAGTSRVPLPVGSEALTRELLAARSAATALVATLPDTDGVLGASDGGPATDAWIAELRRRARDGVYVEA